MPYLEPSAPLPPRQPASTPQPSKPRVEAPSPSRHQLQLYPQYSLYDWHPPDLEEIYESLFKQIGADK